MKKHNKEIPLWVLAKVMTFGSVSKMYALLQQKQQGDISSGLYFHCNHQLKNSVFALDFHLSVILFYDTLNVVQPHSVLLLVRFGCGRNLVKIFWTHGRVFDWQNKISLLFARKNCNRILRLQCAASLKITVSIITIAINVFSFRILLSVWKPIKDDNALKHIIAAIIITKIWFGIVSSMFMLPWVLLFFFINKTIINAIIWINIFTKGKISLEFFSMIFANMQDVLVSTKVIEKSKKAVR